MVQYDYNKPISVKTEAMPPKFTKMEEGGLPGFSKEVPLRTIVKKHGSGVTIEYEWNAFGGEEIKIGLMAFRNDDNLRYVHKIKIKDGEEVGSFKIASSVYIIRKTSEGVAKTLLKVSDGIKASVASVVGYMRSVNGNFYTISKVEADAWSMDSRTGLKPFSTACMSKEEKRRFSDLVMTELLKLYSQGYSLAGFDIRDVIVTRNRVILGNLASLAKAKASRSIAGLAGNLRALAKSGIAEKGDVIYNIALSLHCLRRQYAAWAREKGFSPAESVLMEKMEESIGA